MKTRFLIIIGMIIAVTISITYVTLAYNQEIKLATGMVTSDEKPQPQRIFSDPVCFVVDRTSSGETGSVVTMDTCISLNQFEKMGCTKPMLEHLYKHSNLLNEYVDGPVYLDWAGLPDGIPYEKFDKCFDAILEKRPILDSKSAQEHYEIEITGLKDAYMIGEQYDFSYIISGFGYSCGSKTVSFPDQTGEIIEIHSFALCDAETVMKEFVFDIQKEQGTTFGHIALQNSGTYSVTVTFDRPSQEFPTTASKDFQVMENENYPFGSKIP